MKISKKYKNIADALQSWKDGEISDKQLFQIQKELTKEKLK